MNMTEETRKMVDAIKRKDEALRKNNSTYKHYFAPDIQEKVIKKLIKNFDSHLPINSLIAYYDTTLLSTCRGGLVFTNDGLYYKYIGKAIYFRYTDIIMMEAYNGKLDLKLDNEDMSEYTLIDVLDMEVLSKLLKELIDIDKIYGQTSAKGTGKIKKMDLPPEKLKKCKTMISSASAMCGAVGAGFSQIPGSDNAVIVPIQIGMIVGLGGVFDLNITEAAAKSIIASSGATVAGRTASQFLFGWIPGLGNAINTATAAGLTEAIGWMAVKDFYNRWVQDLNKGRMEGMKDGYREASEIYEQKLREQAAKFISQEIVFQEQKDEYEKLLDEYEEYIKNLEREQGVAKSVNSDLPAMRKQFSQLNNLKMYA